MMMSIEERYLRDPIIHNLVNTMINAIETLKLTPSELRECAQLASIKFEQAHVRKTWLYGEEHYDN